jgi:hypothetical protein
MTIVMMAYAEVRGDSPCKGMPLLVAIATITNRFL